MKIQAAAKALLSGGSAAPCHPAAPCSAGGLIPDYVVGAYQLQHRLSQPPPPPQQQTLRRQQPQEEQHRRRHSLASGPLPKRSRTERSDELSRQTRRQRLLPPCAPQQTLQPGAPLPSLPQRSKVAVAGPAPRTERAPRLLARPLLTQVAGGAAAVSERSLRGARILVDVAGEWRSGLVTTECHKAAARAGLRNGGAMARWWNVVFQSASGKQHKLVVQLSELHRGVSWVFLDTSKGAGSGEADTRVGPCLSSPPPSRARGPSTCSPAVQLQDYA